MNDIITIFNLIHSGKVKVNPINKDHEFYHGVICGKDFPIKELVDNDQEVSIYNAIVIDTTKRGKVPLKDILTGRVTDCLVEKFKTDNSKKAIEFFYLYNKKDNADN